MPAATTNWGVCIRPSIAPRGLREACGDAPELGVARSFNQVTREALEWTADELRVSTFGRRQFAALAQLPALLQELSGEVQARRQRQPDAAIYAAGEARLLRVIEHIILKSTLAALAPR